MKIVNQNLDTILGLQEAEIKKINNYSKDDIRDYLKVREKGGKWKGQNIKSKKERLLYMLNQDKSSLANYY